MNTKESMELFTYTSGECYKLCPSYTVKMNKDGALSFEGIKNTKVTGEKKVEISAASKLELIKLLDNIKTEKLKKRYNATLRDLPEKTLVYGSNAILFKGYGPEAVPKVITELTDKIEELLKLHELIN